MLGIRTAIKDDLQCTTAELVYGTTLRLPGEFFEQHSTITIPDPTSYATQLKDTMSKLRATPTRAQSNHKTFVQKDLKSGTHAFVPHDAVRKSLQRPYDGPYRIIKRTDKHYTLDVKEKHEVISLDRLKPAHLDTHDPDLIRQDQSPSNLLHLSLNQLQNICYFITLHQQEPLALDATYTGQDALLTSSLEGSSVATNTVTLLTIHSYYVLA